MKISNVKGSWAALPVYFMPDVLGTQRGLIHHSSLERNQDQVPKGIKVRVGSNPNASTSIRLAGALGGNNTFIWGK